MGPSRQKIKLDQSALDSNLVPPLFDAHARLLALNLVNCTDADRTLYQARCSAELRRLQQGLSVGAHSAARHPKIRGGMTGSGTVYAVNVTAVRVALSDALSVALNIPIEHAIDLLEGGYDGDDSLHSFMTPVDLERWFSVCQARWGIRPKLEWSKETATPDCDWTGLPIRGWQVVPATQVQPILMKAGIHPDSPSYPSRAWVRATTRLDMRYCVPTSRNWKSHHEAMRSHIESCFMDDARFKLATKHLRRLRAEWRTLGPEARRFLKARPVPDRNKVLRRFYLSSKAAPIQAESSDSIHSFVPIWEARLNWGLASGLAALRQLAAERLAAERLSLSARDALYVQEAVTEHHVYLSTAPETMLVFEQRCAASIFGTVTRPAEFWARIQHKAPAVWERPFWAGKAQLLTWVTLLLGLLQRFLARQRIIGVFVRLYALLTSGSAGFWSAISILAFLGPGQIDPRTSNLVLKDGNLYRKLLACILTALVPTPLCILSVPQVLYTGAYMLVAALARLGAVQFILQPSKQPDMSDRVSRWKAAWQQITRSLNSHGRAAVQAATGTGKGQVLLPLAHQTYETVLVLAPSKFARNSQPAACLDRRDNDPAPGSLLLEGRCG